jgi:hypothetical protein
MKAWVSSAFDNPLVSTSSSNNATTTSRKTSKQKILKSHKSDEPINSTICSTSSILTKKTSTIDSDSLLSEKYEPKTRAELMVNKSKVDELSNFLDASIRKITPSIFILNGPPGNYTFVDLNSIQLTNLIQRMWKICNFESFV